MGLRTFVLVALVGCSGSKPKVFEDGRPPTPPPSDAAVAKDAAVAAVTLPSGPYHEDKGARGDVQVRVEWKDVPGAARAPAGRTSCGTAKQLAVAPTTTWGIPDVFVAIAIDHGKAMAEPAARVVLDHCALGPRAIVAGKQVAIASAADAPAALGLAQAAVLATLAPVKSPTVIAVQLPIAGHEVVAALEPGGIYRVAASGDDGAEAWIASADTPYVAVTEASGQVVLRDVPTGTFPVVAWLPPRAGQGARIGRGTVTVAAGALAEVTLDLAPAP